jgi:hypothetical protein
LIFLVLVFELLYSIFHFLFIRDGLSVFIIIIIFIYSLKKKFI